MLPNKPTYLSEDEEVNDLDIFTSIILLTLT